jgi:predicted DNA-binding transcriptional regulator AlpA
MDSIKTIRIDELSWILRRAESSIRSDICRKPESLPPRIKMPGSSRLLWLESDVLEWLKSNRQILDKSEAK